MLQLSKCQTRCLTPRGNGLLASNLWCLNELETDLLRLLVYQSVLQSIHVKCSLPINSGARWRWWRHVGLAPHADIPHPRVSANPSRQFRISETSDVNLTFGPVTALTFHLSSRTQTGHAFSAIMANQGILHSYTDKLVAFEHANPSAPTATSDHIILWIGGLGDGLLTVHYPKTLARALPNDWSLAEVLLSSSYKGWGTGSLKRDAREVADCVAYFKKERPGIKIVLMGHSTGCQDIMEYLVGVEHEGRPGVDGAILQGGVSDREALTNILTRKGRRDMLEEAIAKTKEMIDEGKEEHVFSAESNHVALELGGGPITAYRAYSLVAKGGDDDYFSSDLEDATLQNTFGKIPESTPLMFLLGSDDPYVPESISKEGLLERWTKTIRAGGGVVDDVNGGVVPGAHHNLDGDPDKVVQDLVKRVFRFCRYHV
jgi:pimeloyl-ACP methyl ester carboxylesterase